MIETNRLILRPFKLSDHADMLEYQSDPDVVRYVPWPVRTPEQVQEALEKGLSCTKIEKQGDSVLLSIELKENNKVVEGKVVKEVKEEKSTEKEVKNKKVRLKKYNVIGGVFSVKKNAMNYVKQAQADGYQAAIAGKNKKGIRLKFLTLSIVTT